MRRRILLKRVLAIVLALAIIGAFICWFILRPLSPEKIFAKTVQSIVELKASSQSSGDSYGTAICIGDDGKFVTNAHIVTYTQLGTEYQYEELSIRFSDEENYRSINLVKYDRDADIAVLQLPDKSVRLKALKCGNSDDLRFGEAVYAIGNGSNYGLSITSGIISMPKVNIEYENHTKEVIQCDLTVSSGNSGGALLDKRGRLIGITSFRLRDSYGDVIYGIAYCLPINQVLSYCNENL